MLIDSDLYAFINRGFYNEENKRLCFKFIAECKWYGDPYYCKSEACSGGRYKFKEYISLDNHERFPYSRMCSRCKHIETPTANTSLHGINCIPAFFQMVYLLTTVQKTERRRLSNSEIFQKLNEGGNIISKTTIEGYRYKIQNYLVEFLREYKDCARIYGVEKFMIKRGHSKRWIYVLCQYSFPRQITATVYNEDNYTSLLHFLTNSVYKDAAVILYDWNKSYPALKNKFLNLSFSNEYLNLRSYVTEIGGSIKNWLRGIDLTDSTRVNSHMNECIHILYQEYFTPVQLLGLIIGFDLQKKRR
jgi:hypothetical protein